MDALASSFALPADGLPADGLEHGAEPGRMGPAEMDAGPGALTQWPTAPARSAPSSPKGAAPPLCYQDLLRKLGSGGGVDAPSCAAMFTRNELRFLLKRNGVSYHKTGKSNMMKTKLDMANDLVVSAAPLACAADLLVLTTAVAAAAQALLAAGSLRTPDQVADDPMSPGEPVADDEELREFAHNMLSEDGEAAESGADAPPPLPPPPPAAAAVEAASAVEAPAPAVVPAVPQPPKAASPRAAPKHDPLNTAALEEMMRAKEEQVRETGLFFQRTSEPDPPAMGGQPAPTQPNGAQDSAEPMLPLQPAAQEQGPASAGGSGAAPGPPPPSEPPPPPTSKRPAPPASDNDEQSKTLKPKAAGGAEAVSSTGTAAAGSDGAGGPDEPPKKKRRYPKPKPRQMWTKEEHTTFCDAIQKHGRDWSRVTEIIGSKTVQQVRRF